VFHIQFNIVKGALLTTLQGLVALFHSNIQKPLRGTAQHAMFFFEHAVVRYEIFAFI
jgi:hypothetical protein